MSPLFKMPPRTLPFPRRSHLTTPSSLLRSPRARVRRVGDSERLRGASPASLRDFPSVRGVRGGRHSPSRVLLREARRVRARVPTGSHAPRRAPASRLRRVRHRVRRLVTPRGIHDVARRPLPLPRRHRRRRGRARRARGALHLRRDAGLASSIQTGRASPSNPRTCTCPGRPSMRRTGRVTSRRRSSRSDARMNTTGSGPTREPWPTTWWTRRG